MDRREALRFLGSGLAIASLGPAELDALVASDARRRSAIAFFTEEQREAVTALADMIIPTTDTSGAVEAGVVEYIEMIVSEWMNDEERRRFMRGLAHVDEHTEAEWGVRFAHVTEDQRFAVLTGMEAESTALAERDPDAPDGFFHQLRGLVLHGYYTSEVGMVEELMFVPIPGRYDGCVDVSEVTRAVPEA